MHGKSRAADLLPVVGEGASQLFTHRALQQQVQGAAMVGHSSSSSWLQ